MIRKGFFELLGGLVLEDDDAVSVAMCSKGWWDKIGGTGLNTTLKKDSHCVRRR